METNFEKRVFQCDYCDRKGDREDFDCVQNPALYRGSDILFFCKNAHVCEDLYFEELGESNARLV